MANMKTYQHTQKATFTLVGIVAIVIVFAILGTTVTRPILTALPILILVAWLFCCLTIEIADGELRWRFGPGLIRKRVPLGEIASATTVRTNFFEGWGIHYSRFGWLYNVSGFDAVAITLKNGKRFCLGTDEPEKLIRSLPQPYSRTNVSPTS